MGKWEFVGHSWLLIIGGSVQHSKSPITAEGGAVMGAVNPCMSGSRLNSKGATSLFQKGPVTSTDSTQKHRTLSDGRLTKVERFSDNSQDLPRSNALSIAIAGAPAL